MIAGGFFRASFVPDVSRVDRKSLSLELGRIGTQRNIRCAEMLLADGVTIAEEVLKGCSVLPNGGNMLSISSAACREAIASARCFDVRSQLLNVKTASLSDAI